ncbi:hypothetical protein V1514DRAFT_325174 [Lipomyces japonicus]|uniref:uncharacterized protein n=1 Tax=Lipomyces japonicus TaxID=56871 RepID=UPI0034CEF3DF
MMTLSCHIHPSIHPTRRKFFFFFFLGLFCFVSKKLACRCNLLSLQLAFFLFFNFFLQLPGKRRQMEL